MISFKVGDRVVCIDAYVGFEQWLGIKEGKIYTVSWIGPFEHYTQGSFIGVRLAGITRPTCPHFGYEDMPFNAKRFRPLVIDRLSSLRGLLAGGPVAEKFEESKRKVTEGV